MSRQRADVVVIGGGASGMMCSAVAAERGLDVILLEPNKILGRKLRITGKGRCNVTNNCDIKEFLTNIPGDGRFLYSALNRLSPRDTMELFEGLGLKLKTERGNRVFPVSDNANDVAGALQRYMHRSGVRIERLLGKAYIDRELSCRRSSDRRGRYRLPSNGHMYRRTVIPAHRLKGRRL